MNDDPSSDAIWKNLPSRRELHTQLDRMAMSADAKVLMGKLLDTTAEVAGKIVEVGRHILSFVLEMFRRYPATTLGAFVGLTVSMLVGAIPVLGLVLGPLVGPLLAAFMITQGALVDMRNSTIDRQIELFGSKLDAALARG